VWSWLHGTTPKPASNGQPVGSLVEDLQSPERQTRRKAADALAGCGAAGDAVEPLEAALNDVDESVRLHAAYALATAGDSGVKTLIQHLRDDAMAAEERALAKTADNAHGTNPTAQVAAQALGVAPGAIGPLAALLTDEHWLVRASAADALGNRPIEAEQVMEELVTAADDDHWWVRRNAIEALGRSRKMTDRARVKVSACLRDEDYRVRRNAALAMRQSPEAVADTIYGLAGMLSDENRYNRFYAVDALRQLAPADDAAQTLLIDYLFTARWCALTNSESAF
jgi:HEAT repeat protein